MFKKLVAYLVIFSIFMIDIATAMRKTLSYEDLQAKEARQISKSPSRRASFSGNTHKNGSSFLDNQSAIKANGLPSLLPSLRDTETIDEQLSLSANNSSPKGSNDPSSNETSLREEQNGLKSSSSEESLRRSNSSGSENEKDDIVSSSPESRNSSPKSDKSLEDFGTIEKLQEALQRQIVLPLEEKIQNEEGFHAQQDKKDLTLTAPSLKKKETISNEDEILRSNSEEDLGSTFQGSPPVISLNGSPTNSIILGESDGSPTLTKKGTKEGNQTGSPKTEDEISLTSSNSSMEDISSMSPLPAENIKDKALHERLLITRTEGDTSSLQEDTNEKTRTEKSWDEIFKEFKESSKGSPSSLLTQEKRVEYNEKSSLLPKNGSIQTYDTTAEEDFVWVIDTQQGSFSTIPSEKNAWLRKIPLYSLFEAFLDKKKGSIENKKNKRKKGDAGLLVEPSEQESQDDEIIPTHQLKSDESSPSISLNQDHEEREGNPLISSSQPTIAKKEDKNIVIYGTGGEDPENGKNGMVLVIPEDIDPRVKAFLICPAPIL